MSISTTRTNARLTQTRKDIQKLQEEIDKLRQTGEVQVALVETKLQAMETTEQVLQSQVPPGPDAAQEVKDEYTKAMQDLRVSFAKDEQALLEARQEISRIDAELHPMYIKMSDLKQREAKQLWANIRQALEYPIRLASHLNKCAHSGRTDIRTRKTVMEAREVAITVRKDLDHDAALLAGKSE